MFPKNSSSFDEMESGVLRPQTTSECTVDLSPQMPSYPREKITWTLRERSTVPSTFQSFSISTDYSAKAISSNKLQSPCSDTVNIPPDFSINSKCQQDFKNTTSPKSEQCVVDISLWNSESGDINKNTTGRFVDQTLPYQHDYSMSTKSCNTFPDKSSFSKDLSQGRSMDQIITNESSVRIETLNTAIFQVVSEVSSPNRKQAQIFKSNALEGFAVVSNTETIPRFETSSSNSKKSTELSQDLEMNSPSTNEPQNEDIRSPEDGSAKVRKQNGIPENSKQDEKFMDGFAAGLRSRHVHQPPREAHQNVLRTSGAHSGMSVFNICETTYRPSLHKNEQQFSFVEYTIDTQHKDLR